MTPALQQGVHGQAPNREALRNLGNCDSGRHNLYRPSNWSSLLFETSSRFPIRIVGISPAFAALNVELRPSPSARPTSGQRSNVSRSAPVGASFVWFAVFRFAYSFLSRIVRLPT